MVPKLIHNLLNRLLTEDNTITVDVNWGHCNWTSDVQEGETQEGIETELLHMLEAHGLPAEISFQSNRRR